MLEADREKAVRFGVHTCLLAQAAIREFNVADVSVGVNSLVVHGVWYDICPAGVQLRRTFDNGQPVSLPQDITLTPKPGVPA